MRRSLIAVATPIVPNNLCKSYEICAYAPTLTAQAAIYNQCSAIIAVDLQYLKDRKRNYCRTVLVFIFSLRSFAPRACKASTRIPKGNPRAEPPCNCYPHPRRKAEGAPAPS